MELTLLLCLLLAGAARSQGPGGYDFFSRWMRPNRGLGHLGINRRTDFGGVSGFRTSYLRPGGRYQTSHGREHYRVRLVGGSNSREGNVEVLIYDWRQFLHGWRSVCDVGWTQAHAAAVCKQLNFPGRAVATHNGRFGFRSAGIGTIVRNCQVGSRGLRQCFHEGVGGYGECSSNNLAGVICGRDTATPYNRDIAVRLRGSRLRGDVQVKYGRYGWRAVCGDGFGMKEAAVVCKQLKLGAPVRSYLSGRDAGGSFILGEVECTGRERNIGFCKSRRGSNVRCPGNRFSGAAIQCSAPPGGGGGGGGARLPDLVIDPQEVQKSVFIESQTMQDLECAMDERCLAPSAYEIKRREPRTYRTRRRVLFRFTNKVRNIGQADYRPRLDPSQWEWHSCHRHYHSEESFSQYNLVIPGSGGQVASGHKASFCLEDSECDRGITPKYRCEVASDRRTRFPQGIRAGCADIYGSYIDCQWMDITDVKSGTYQLRIRVNAERLVPEVSFDNNEVLCNVQLNMRTQKARVTNCRNVPLSITPQQVRASQG